MIRAIHGQGANRATACCDTCGREEVVTCNYTRLPGGGWQADAGQVHRKMTGRGWALVKGKLLCPTCDAHRRALSAQPAIEIQNGEVSMTRKVQSGAAAEPLRQPSQDQRGDIIEMLVVSYDRKAKRYKGKDTDKTVAEAIGGGCLPGWVTEIRERDFGPAGGNEELDGIRNDLGKVREDLMARLCAIDARIDAVCAAVGPKAGRI